jgi:hypothetical protein
MAGSIKKGERRNPNGRPKGSKDKRREFYDVVKALQETGHDPVRAIIKIAQDELASLEMQHKANATLLTYAAPALKAVQHDHTVDVSEDLKQLAENMKEIMKGFVRDF